MSLVQEPLIGVFNRRFVFSFFDVFTARMGGDKDAADFLKKNGAMAYGTLFTPAGKCLGAFGYNMAEVYKAIADTKKKVPEFWSYTDAEKEVLKRAKQRPEDLGATVAAAQLHMELLDFAKADAALQGFIDRVTNANKADMEHKESKDSKPNKPNKPNKPQDKIVARYWQLHHRLAENNLLFHQYGAGWKSLGEERQQELTKMRMQLRKELAGLQGLPEELEDDRQMDEISTYVQLSKRSGFYTGWYTPKKSAQGLHDRLQKLIAVRSDSNRIGEMHFYLGLTLRALKKNKAADAVWKKHDEDYPADRFAMLSRFHHTSYQFSPYGGGRGSSVMGFGQKRMSPKQVEKALERLRPKGNR